MTGTKRRLAYHVTVADDGGELRTYGPGDEVPAAVAKRITNASAWVAGEADDQDEDGAGTEYADQTVDELRAEIDRRNAERSEEGQIEVSGKGNKPDLIDALEADDQVNS